VPRNCLHDPTRIDLLFTMSEISQTASHKDSRCKAMFRGRIVLEHCLSRAIVSIKPSGGARRDRTDDLMLAKHALSQLSYGPVPEDECLTRPTEPRQRQLPRSTGTAHPIKWWAWEDLNFRPHAYQARALTN
jgi:hypothetical protein